MEIDIKLYPDKICRACLTKSSSMRSLETKIEGEERTLLDMLIFVANITLKTDANIPNQVCSDCESVMWKADAFKRLCLESESYLNQLINNADPSHYQIDFEISEKLTVKDEECYKKSNVSVKKSSNKVKRRKSEIFEALFNSTLKSENIFSQLDVPCSTSATDIVSNDDKDNMVKEEISHDFDSDMGFSAPIEYKQENPKVNELDVLSCSCGTMFHNADDYDAHVKTKKCRTNGCKQSMKIKMEKKNLNGGRSIIIKRKILCKECNLEFDTIKACRLHRRQHGSDETGQTYQCTYCMRKFDRKSSYTTHLNNHDAKSKVKHTCETCKRDFQYKAHLDNHVIAVHSREKGYTCENCLMNFSTQESLDIHKSSHMTEKKHRCTICQKAFIMMATLNDHMRIHTGERPFLCSVCGRGFSQKTNLAQHMRRHLGQKPFKCDDCDRRFVSKGELVAHTRKHSGAHPFVCDDCGSGFTTSSSLVKHRRIHTGERPYACDLCPMKFSASGTLKNHRRTHTGEKPFQCSYCEKAFVQRQDLVSHIRYHTGERPYGCTCGQAFRKAASLKAHARQHARQGGHGPVEATAAPRVQL